MFIQEAFAATDTITTQEPEAPKAAPDTTMSTLSSLVPMIAIFVVFYFLLIRPQEKKRKQQEELVNSIKKGEEIVTNGGIFGTVVSVDESNNVAEIEIAKDTKIKISKNAIVDILSRKKEIANNNVPKSKKKGKGE